MGAIRIISGLFRRVCMVLLCALAFGASGAAAQTCHAPLPDTFEVADVASASLEWDCSGTEPATGRGRTAVRIAPAADAAEPPELFVAPVGRFQQLELVGTSETGEPLVAHHSSHELLSAKVESLFIAPLPAGMETTAPFYAVFTGLEFPQTALEARVLVDRPVNEPHAARTIALISLICGFLLVPILLNVAYFRILPSGFLFWHSVMALAFATHFAASGPLATVFTLHVFDLVLLREGSFALAVVAGHMFIATFMEPGKLDRWTVRALQFGALWVTGLFLLKVGVIDIARSHVMLIYFVGYLPVLGLCLFASLQAFRRGSRAAKFQLVGWMPFLLLALLRIFTMAAGVAVYVEASWAARVAVAFEIFVTTLGVADRFIAIKRERDIARAEARTLEHVSEHDPLTGLLNRRAIDRRFVDLRDDGFSTMALIDLDHFKGVNDRFGHQVGDDVLKATAEAIDRPEDPDCIAIRLGGEEFMVLLRGADAVNRLDMIRQSITLRIAREVPGLDEPVTASMGVIEIPAEGLTDMDFSMLYGRADELLYEAKETGRNRSVYERLILFRPDNERRKSPRVERRAAAG